MRNRMSGGVRGRRRKPPPTRSIYVLVSTTKAFRLEENLRAFTVNLSEEENQYLNLQEE